MNNFKGLMEDITNGACRVGAKRVYYNQYNLSELNLEYPCICLYHTNSQMQGALLNHTFQVLWIDKVNSAESNIFDIQNDGFRGLTALQNVIESDVQSNFETFKQSFGDLCAGVSTTINGYSKIDYCNICKE